MVPDATRLGSFQTDGDGRINPKNVVWTVDLTPGESRTLEQRYGSSVR